LVPLVVVRTNVHPRQTLALNSPGELPRSNPANGSPQRSPASSTRPARIDPARVLASSTSAQGLTAEQPAAKAWTMQVVARKTSTTTATPPARLPFGTKLGNKWTWTSRSTAMDGDSASSTIRWRILRRQPDGAKRKGKPRRQLGSAQLAFRTLKETLQLKCD
jgi:hypothetical protein